MESDALGCHRCPILVYPVRGPAFAHQILDGPPAGVRRLDKKSSHSRQIVCAFLALQAFSFYTEGRLLHVEAAKVTALDVLYLWRA
jgi:hypothetical protein